MEIRAGKGSIGESESALTSIWAGSESPVRRSTTPTLCVLLIHPAMLVSASCWRRIIFLKNGFLNQSAGTSNCNEYAIGPFVAIEIGGGATATPTSNGPISGYALGLMLGLHHPTAAAADPKLSNSSWNFGVGLRVDPSAKVLADGVAANRPPPAGITTTDQLFKKEPRYGIMLLSSFSF